VWPDSARHSGRRPSARGDGGRRVERAAARFIPVELWTGGNRDGSRTIHMTPADLVFGAREQKAVRGPLPWTTPRNRARPLTVTILDLDFVYDRVQHLLRFHWLMNEDKGRGTDMTYVYSPGRGLVHLEGNE
jgi:hypothetical protein